jgi:hypothetical protein
MTGGNRSLDQTDPSFKLKLQILVGSYDFGESLLAIPIGAGFISQKVGETAESSTFWLEIL